KTDMRDARRWNEREHAVEKADTGAQYRRKRKLFPRNLGRLHRLKRRLDVDHLQRQVTGDLIAEQHADFVQQLPKTLDRAVPLPHQREFVLNQGMAHKIYVFAGHIKGSTPFQAISPDASPGRKAQPREKK